MRPSAHAMIATASEAVTVEQLLDEHAAALRRYLRARCGDADLTDDLMQEVALRVVRASARLDAGRNVRGFLFRTAANVWRDHLRRELVRRRRSADPEPRLSAAADADVLERELTGAVHAAVAALPRAQREVVELRHRTGLTFREIAERLGRPLGTVLGQMRAALQKIQIAIEDYR
jgi:RNA polymerase sigma-70 factor (ECF subfamily)